LAKEITALIDKPDEITRMEVAGRQLARRDAATATVELMEGLVKGRKR